MKIFLSYARLDWHVHSEAFGSTENGFLERLQQHLNQTPRVRASIWRDDRMVPGRDWKGELARQIDSADVFLILFSEAWACSEVCWWEYMHARASKPDMPVAGIWLQPMPETLDIVFDDEAAPPNLDRYRHAFKTLWSNLRKPHAPDATGDAARQKPDFDPDVEPFLDRLDRAFRDVNGRQSRMNAFVRPYSTMVSELFKSRREKPLATLPQAAVTAPAQFETRTVAIAGQAQDFLQVPAGRIELPGGPYITITRPFWIMREPVPAPALLRDTAGAPLPPTKLRRLPSVIRGLASARLQLRVPSEDQWDAALAHFGKGNAADPAPRIAAPSGRKELVVGHAPDRRSFAAMTQSERETVLVKWVEGTDIRFRRLNLNGVVGQHWLRLAIGMD